MPVEPSETMALLMEFLDAQLADTAVDASRVFVTGISMGGYGTWDLLCRRPEVFAAAMPVCGGADVAQASKIAKVPIWVFHGDSDSTVPVCRSRNMVSALWQCGGKVRYREYPGVGHNCWTQTYADKDVLKWFFEQRKTPDLAAQGAEIAVHRGRADATGVFSVDGGDAVTFDGKFALPTAAKRVDISLSPDGTRRGVRSSGNYHDLTDDALRLHGMFTNETADTAATLPDPERFEKDVPRPLWDGHDDAVRCFAHCLKVTGRDYLRAPEPGSGFTRNFVYTPFGSQVFLWGTSFISMYGRYASHIFPFASMLDNFYGAQHRDGWIPRSIFIIDGATGDKGDLSTSGCNMTGWAEWRSWEWSGDTARLRKVYPSLLAFHRWLRENRTWKDGTYFCNGLGCGMDNIVRFDTSKHSLYNHHGYISWLDVTLQETMNARFLLKIAKVLGTSEGVAELEEEVERLTRIVNEQNVGC